MKVILLGCVGDENVGLLPHLLSHYQKLGVDEFRLILHSKSGDSREYRSANSILRSFGVKPCLLWTGEFQTYEKHRRLKQMFDRFVDPEDWVIPSDVDEFRVFPNELKEFLSFCESHQYFYVRGQLVDRLALGGKLPRLSADRSLKKQFPLGSRVTRTLVKGHSAKIVALKGFLRFNMGHHFLSFPFRSSCWKFEYPQVLNVHHFKWDESVIPRLEYRSRVYREVGLPWFLESENLFDFLARNKGRLDPANPKVNAFRVTEDNVVYSPEEKLLNQNLGYSYCSGRKSLGLL